MKMGTLIGIGVAAVGGYLIWRQMRPQPTFAPAQIPGLLPTDTMLPGTTIPAANGILMVPGGAPLTAEGYLTSVGNPQPGATVTAMLPPAGLFEPYPENKAKGPKQRKCLKQGGAWDGPIREKFCIMPG